MVFLSLELWLQNLERGELPVWAMKHLCTAAQGHTATGTLCQPCVCCLHTAPVFPRSAWGLPTHPWDIHTARTPRPARAPTAQTVVAAPQGGHDQRHGCRKEQPPRASACCGQWCLQHFPHSGKYSRQWLSDPASLPMQWWEYGAVTWPCQWQRLKISSQLFPRGCLLPPSWQAWLTVQTLLAPVRMK